MGKRQYTERIYQPGRHGRRSDRWRRTAPPSRPQTTFSPTLSVERPVVWPSEEAQKEYWQSMHKALGKGVTRNQRDHYRVVRPDKLRVVQIRPTVLAEMSRDIHRYDQRQAAMERLAGMLHEQLYESLRDVPERLPVSLGRLACIAEQQPSRQGRPVRSKEIVGAQIAGWRGERANYSRNGDGGCTLRQLAAEKVMYSDAIIDTNAWFDPEVIVADPYIAVIEDDQPIRRQAFSRLIDSIRAEDALPELAELGDPVIRLRTGQRPDDFIEYPVRGLGSYQPLAA